ncbi:hypothetical protein VPH35_047245 [Triticum aestivum]
MPQSLAGFFYEGYNRNRFPKEARYFTNVSGEGDPLIDPSLSFLAKCESLAILDCCNGLLLCRCGKATDPNTMDYVVCNPATEKWVVVPATDWSCKVSVARLGFEPAVSSHFHVFEFIDQKTWAGVWKYQTVKHGPFAIPKHSVSSFLNGVLNLAADYNLTVLSVDVEGDNWWLVPIPERPDYVDDTNGIFYISGTVDYVTGKWTLKHNVSHLQLFETEYSWYANNYSVISVHPERSLLFIVGGDERTLMSYDMDSIELCFIRELGSECKAEWPVCGNKTPFYPHVPLFSESLADGY